MIPLVRRFPALAAVPRAPLARTPTPVESADAVAVGLWIKRDDLSGTIIGGNKVRALEFLLGTVRAGDRVVTVGGLGSTHALATAVYARALGARAEVGLWRQEMNPWADRVSERLEEAADTRRTFRSPLPALAWAQWRRLRGARWVPPGGTSVLGILGHVNAALELATQIEEARAPLPSRIVVPLGTGGTAAGLALGMRIAGLMPTIVAARVVPRAVARLGRVVRLANRTAAWLEHATGSPVPRVTRSLLRITHSHYGGAYGRAAPTGEAAARAFQAIGVPLDATYSAKACAAAIAECSGGVTLFWLTFDAAAVTRAYST